MFESLQYMNQLSAKVEEDVTVGDGVIFIIKIADILYFEDIPYISLDECEDV